MDRHLTNLGNTVLFLTMTVSYQSILRSLVAMTGPCQYDLVRTRPGFNSRRGSFFLDLQRRMGFNLLHFFFGWRH